jgi:hypothetical protein
MGLLEQLKCKFKFNPDPIIRKKKAKKDQKRGSSQVRPPSLAKQGTPTAQKASRIEQPDHSDLQPDVPDHRNPQENKGTNPNQQGKIVDGPLVNQPLLSPRVDILKDMKATLSAHGLSLQDQNTPMFGTSLFKIKPLHAPELPEAFARRAHLGVYPQPCFSLLEPWMNADPLIAPQSDMCPFCDDEFPAKPSMKLISLRAMLKRNPQTFRRLEQSNPDALYLPVILI